MSKPKKKKNNKMDELLMESLKEFISENEKESSEYSNESSKITESPSKLEPKEITRIYKIPSKRFQSEEELLKKYKYILKDKLCEGSFAAVYCADDLKKNREVACKIMSLGTSWNDCRVTDMKNEIFIMKKVKNLYIIKLYTHFIVESTKNGIQLFIFMELADNGDLAKFLKKKGSSLTENVSKLYMAQIVCGVNHIHLLGIAHRDIKLQNILVKKNSSSISGDYMLLVCDFGLSRVIHYNEQKKIKLNQTVCGSPVFMAPEILRNKPYNAFLVDIWALGVTLFVLMTYDVPFNFREKSQAIKNMRLKKYVFNEEKMKDKPSEEFESIISGTLEPKQKKRLTMQKLIKHEWLEKSFIKAQKAANKIKIK